MIKVANGFCDLCIPYNEKKEVMLEIFKELIDAGYRNVAVEQTYSHESLNSKNGNDLIPEPVKLDEFKEQLKNKLNLFNRLTIEYSDPSVSHACGRSLNFKKYHLIAALPTTETALQHSCQMFLGDIITYNEETVKIRLSRKFYYLAIRRNMFFELKYSPAIIDSSERRATISRAQQYHMIGKSRGIILTSEAKDPFHIRNPYDVGCLGYIFGLSEEQGRSAVSTLGRKVLLAAESRRLGKTPVLVKYEDVNSSSDEEEGGSDEEDEIGAEEQSSEDNLGKRKDNSCTDKNNKRIKIS
ncbi:ribonuclease P protein subunit p30 [Chironomus tepperi]|uniref:ribonuclease P protein subunit p30 n=1 Tax=Chironomus tepperi TaxID=113505 RepID=UPI00391F79AD